MRSRTYRYDGSSAWPEEAKLLASDGLADDRFGFAVSVSGEIAVIGADQVNGTGIGAAYAYRWGGSTWLEEAKLLASDGAADDHLGGAVSVSGTVAVAGALLDDDLGTSSGSAYVFDLSFTDGTLTLETPAGCQSDEQITVELWMRDCVMLASGYQAFLTYDETVLTYRDDLSAYTGAPFPEHLTDIADAEDPPGELQLDASVSFGGAGTMTDSHLATLVFDVDVECSTTTVAFDHTQDLESESSSISANFWA